MASRLTIFARQILQYAYRFFAWRAEDQGRPKDAAALLKISGQVSMARKLTRVGYWMEEVVKVVQALDVRGPQTAESLLAAVRAASAAVYWGLDNLYWAQKLELFQVADTARVNRFRIAFWLASVLLSLQPAFKSYMTARRGVKRDEPKTQTALNVQSANIIRLAGDVVVASSFAVAAEVLPPLFEVHEGVVGLAGVTSGVAGLYMTLNK